MSHDHLDISLNDNQIEHAKASPYLGITIDQTIILTNRLTIYAIKLIEHLEPWKEPHFSTHWYPALMFNTTILPHLDYRATQHYEIYFYWPTVLLWKQKLNKPKYIFFIVGLIQFVFHALSSLTFIKAVDHSMYVSGFCCLSAASISVISMVLSEHRCVPLCVHSGLTTLFLTAIQRVFKDIVNCYAGHGSPRMQ